MTLQFTSDAPVGDVALSIRFDLNGLQALLTALHAAMADGEYKISAASAGAFGTVAFAYAEDRDDRPATSAQAPALWRSEPECRMFPSNAPGLDKPVDDEE